MLVLNTMRTTADTRIFMFGCVGPVGLHKPIIRVSLCSPESTEDSKDGRTRATLDKETYQNHFTVNSQKANCNLDVKICSVTFILFLPVP